MLLLNKKREREKKLCYILHYFLLLLQLLLLAFILLRRRHQRRFSCADIIAMLFFPFYSVVVGISNLYQKYIMQQNMKKTEVLKLQNNRWASFFPDFATPKRLTQQLENFRSTLL